MDNEITIAIISLISASIVAGFGFLGQIILAKKKSQEEALKDARKQQYQDDRDDYFEEQINIIKKKLDEHNHYAKKFEEVNIKMRGLQKDIEYLRKDLTNGRTKSQKD